MMRKILIIGVVIVVCIIAGYFLLEHLVEFKPLTEKEMEKIVQERIFEQWPKENEHGLITETLDFLLIKKHKIYRVFPKFTIQPGIALANIAVGYDGESFFLPEGFETVIKRENLLIDEEVALEIAKLYVYLQEKSEYRVLILQNTSEIPKNVIYGNDPDDYKKIVTPPSVQKKNKEYYVTLYSWAELGGILTEWTFLITKNGEIKVEKSIVAEGVGSFMFIH